MKKLVILMFAAILIACSPMATPTATPNIPETVNSAVKTAIPQILPSYIPPTVDPTITPAPTDAPVATATVMPMLELNTDIQEGVEYLLADGSTVIFYGRTTSDNVITTSDQFVILWNVFAGGHGVLFVSYLSKNEIIGYNGIQTHVINKPNGVFNNCTVSNKGTQYTIAPCYFHQISVVFDRLLIRGDDLLVTGEGKDKRFMNKP